MPRRPRPAIRTPPPELDADMRPDDLIDELRRLKIEHDEFNAIKIDADVRDFSGEHAERAAAAPSLKQTAPGREIRTLFVRLGFDCRLQCLDGFVHWLG